jgi:tRNA A37 threonylcarbamoyladenosine modification protein TsaB
MIILTLRTDKPEAEIGLYDGQKQLAYETWQAHRQLAETIHKKIDETLISVKPSRLDLSSEAAKMAKNRERYKLSISLEDIQGITVFRGPGSFTGLRIGMSVANALAYSLNIPIVARQDPNWLEAGLADLAAGKNDKIAIPEYGAPAHTTAPRK